MSYETDSCGFGGPCEGLTSLSGGDDLWEQIEAARAAARRRDAERAIEAARAAARGRDAERAIEVTQPYYR